MSGDGAASTLDTLVSSTEGPQPWRKVFHATNALLIAGAIAFFDPTKPVLLLAAGVVATGLVAMDLVRLSMPRANELFFRSFSALASPRESTGLASSTWYAIGILVAAALFDRPALVSGVLVLGLADPAAWLIGRNLGKRPFLGGTVEGVVAFFVTALVVVGLAHGWGIGAVAAATSGLAERRSWPLDDNFTIPVVCAATIAAFGYF